MLATTAYNRKRAYSRSFYADVPSQVGIVCWWVASLFAIIVLLVSWGNLMINLFLVSLLPILALMAICLTKAITNMQTRKQRLAYNADLHRDAVWLQTIILPRHAIDLTYNEAVNLLIGEVVPLNGPKNVRFDGFLSFKELLLDARLMYKSEVQEVPVIS